MSNNTINEKMIIADIIRKYPKCKKVFRYFHIDKTGCGWAGFSTLSIEQAAKSHEIDINKIMLKLNKIIKG